MPRRCADTALRLLVPIAHRRWWTRTQNRTRGYLADTAQSTGAADDASALAGGDGLAHPEVTGPSVLRCILGIELHGACRSPWRCMSASRQKRPEISAGGSAWLGDQSSPEQGRLGMPPRPSFTMPGRLPFGRLGCGCRGAARRQPGWPPTPASRSSGSRVSRFRSRQACRGATPTLTSCSPRRSRCPGHFKGAQLALLRHTARAGDAPGDGRQTMPSASYGRFSTNPRSRSIASCAGGGARPGRSRRAQRKLRPVDRGSAGFGRGRQTRAAADLGRRIDECEAAIGP